MFCSACHKGILSRKRKEMVYTYKEKSITLKQVGLWCDTCDEGILSGDDIAATEKDFEAFKARVDGILNPEEIRHIRKNVLSLTQKDASLIFGGGKNAFSRYERGIIIPSLAVSNLLKSLERHPGDVNYFKGL